MALSIYTLNDGRSDREAAALARRENQSDVIAGVDLSGGNNPVAPILIDLAQRDTINKSSRFAETALGRLAGATDILARSPTAPPAWRCWWRPDVPAVLIELGYLSNSSDAEPDEYRPLAGGRGRGDRRRRGPQFRPARGTRTMAGAGPGPAAIPPLSPVKVPTPDVTYWCLFSA